MEDCGRRGAAGLKPQLAEGLDAQRCSRWPAQPGNSLSTKGKSEMLKIIYCPNHQALYMCVLSIWHPRACMYMCLNLNEREKPSCKKGR